MVLDITMKQMVLVSDESPEEEDEEDHQCTIGNDKDINKVMITRIGGDDDGDDDDDDNDDEEEDENCDENEEDEEDEQDEDEEDYCSDESSTTSTSSTNGQLENTRVCDCCYCEVFGHGVPPTANTSRNYAEMRERLRLRLSKRRAERCEKSNQAAEQNKSALENSIVDEGGGGGGGGGKCGVVSSSPAFNEFSGNTGSNKSTGVVDNRNLDELLSYIMGTGQKDNDKSSNNKRKDREKGKNSKKNSSNANKSNNNHNHNSHNHNPANKESTSTQSPVNNHLKHTNKHNHNQNQVINLKNQVEGDVPKNLQTSKKQQSGVKKCCDNESCRPNKACEAVSANSKQQKRKENCHKDHISQQQPNQASSKHQTVQPKSISSSSANSQQQQQHHHHHNHHHHHHHHNNNHNLNQQQQHLQQVANSTTTQNSDSIVQINISNDKQDCSSSITSPTNNQRVASTAIGSNASQTTKLQTNYANSQQRQQSSKQQKSIIGNNKSKLVDDISIEEDIFKPRNIDFDNNELDEVERELEEFKKFCYDCVPLKERPRLQLKDLKFLRELKRHIDHQNQVRAKQANSSHQNDNNQHRASNACVPN